MGLLELNADDAAVGRQCTEGLFRGDLSGINLGSYQYPAMGKQGYTLSRLLLQLIEKVGYPFVLHGKRLTICCGYVQVVGKPLLQAWIVDFVKRLHLPCAKVDLHDASIADGTRISADGGQAHAARQWAGEYGIKGA